MVYTFTFSQELVVLVHFMGKSTRHEIIINIHFLYPRGFQTAIHGSKLGYNLFRYGLQAKNVFLYYKIFENHPGLCSLGIIPCTERVMIWFQVRAHAQMRAQSTGGACWRQLISVTLSHWCFSFKNIFKWLKIKRKIFHNVIKLYFLPNTAFIL